VEELAGPSRHLLVLTSSKEGWVGMEGSIWQQTETPLNSNYFATC
jgi:hypothetical protein